MSIETDMELDRLHREGWPADGQPITPATPAPEAEVHDYVQAWCLSHGAPPEVVSAVVEQARPPLAPGRVVLARAVVALLAESVERPGNWLAWWSEMAATGVLAMLSFRALNERRVS